MPEVDKLIFPLSVSWLREQIRPVTLKCIYKKRKSGPPNLNACIGSKVAKYKICVNKNKVSIGTWSSYWLDYVLSISFQKLVLKKYQLFLGIASELGRLTNATCHGGGEWNGASEVAGAWARVAPIVPIASWWAIGIRWWRWWWRWCGARRLRS